MYKGGRHKHLLLSRASIGILGENRRRKVKQKCQIKENCKKYHTVRHVKFVNLDDSNSMRMFSASIDLVSLGPYFL